jgi:hypothetical protein
MGEIEESLLHAAKECGYELTIDYEIVHSGKVGNLYITDKYRVPEYFAPLPLKSKHNIRYELYSKQRNVFHNYSKMS